jgi:hypothetical protein
MKLCYATVGWLVTYFYYSNTKNGRKKVANAICAGNDYVLASAISELF